MRKIFREHMSAAGWQPEADMAFRGPHGELVRYIPRGTGLPSKNILLLPLATPTRRFAVAIKVRSDNLPKLGRLARHGRQAVDSGAVRPWLDRVLRTSRAWIGPGDGPWRELRHRAGLDRRPVAVDEAAELLDAVAGEPAGEAMERAVRMAAQLKAAGWRATTGQSTRRVAGQRMLRSAMRRTPSGGVHRLSYVLTGDPVMPEALWWRVELPTSAPRPSKWNYLIDTTGAADPDLPLPAAPDRLDAILGLIFRQIPAMSGSAHLMNTVYGITAITTVSPDGLCTTDMRFTRANMPRLESPSMTEALAAVRAEPDSGDAWLRLGFAATDSRTHHIAVPAFSRAAELGAGQGLPLLWRGWLTRHNDPVAAATDLGRAAEAGGVTGAARERQALVVDEMLGYPVEALEILAIGTTADPGCVDVWQSRGLALAKQGRAKESAEVLTEALKIHNTALLWYYLGYAKTLLHDPYAALDCLEKAIDLDPKLASEIVNDPDLAALEREPRFKSLGTHRT